MTISDKVTQRIAEIAAAIRDCTECGSREFPKRPDCDGCIAAVDEKMLVENNEGDRIAAITRAIATGD